MSDEIPGSQECKRHAVEAMSRMGELMDVSQASLLLQAAQVWA